MEDCPGILTIFTAEDAESFLSIQSESDGDPWHVSAWKVSFCLLLSLKIVCSRSKAFCFWLCAFYSRSTLWKFTENRFLKTWQVPKAILPSLSRQASEKLCCKNSLCFPFFFSNVFVHFRWEDCLFLSLIMLDMPVGKLYVDNYFDRERSMKKVSISGRLEQISLQLKSSMSSYALLNFFNWPPSQQTSHFILETGKGWEIGIQNFVQLFNLFKWRFRWTRWRHISRTN